jgi:hypothetical protein
LQAEGAIALFDQMSGEVDSLRTSAAAFHRGSGERLDVIQVPLRIRGISIGRNANGDEGEG